MTYDDAYREYFSHIVKYSLSEVDYNQYYGEEIASAVLSILYEKWDDLKSHDDKVILTWLYRAADYKIKEFYRTKPPEHISSDDEIGKNLIEQKLYQDDSDIDQFEEAKKYEQYIDQIQKLLKKKELQLFNYKVIQKYNYSQIAHELHISEAAAKMRWHRLQMRIHPQVMSLIKNKV